jgi:antitoxin component YwqK of YwqJK toxin-antitoxin module
MKKALLLIVFVLVGASYVSAQPHKIDELNFQEPNMYYRSGGAFSGEAIDFDGATYNPKRVKFSGHYENGKPIGKIKKWYDNFELQYEENYGAPGIKDGVQKYYYATGKPKEIVYYKKGFLDGIWIKYNEDGQKESEMTYKFGKIFKEINYRNDKRVSEKNYSGGIPQGKVTYNDDNGQSVSENLYSNIISEKHWKDDKEDGTWMTVNGESKKEVVYKSGKIISESNYVHNPLAGQKVEHSENIYKDFMLERETEYFDDKKREATYNNGKKVSEGILVNDKKDGKWMYWLENGDNINIKTYKDGKVLSEETKNAKTLISNFKDDKTSLFFKVADNNKTFIRVNFGINTSDPFVDRLMVIFKDRLRHLDRISEISPEGLYADENYNYFLNVTDFKVTFKDKTCANILSGEKRGFSCIIDFSCTLITVDGKLIDNKAGSNDTDVFFGKCYDDKDLALDGAIYRKDYLKKFIEKMIDSNFPLK